MKYLNFYPYYGELLRSQEKTTTLRLNDPGLSEGERVPLTLGWDENSGVQLHQVKIMKVYKKKIIDLNDQDLEGESPDCKSREAARLVLCAIYKAVVKDQDVIWVVKFAYEG